MSTLSDIWTVSALKQYARECGSHFFDADTMRFFRSRVAPRVYHMATGIVFITSEQFDANSPRLYTVRIMREGANFDDIDGFQAHSSLRQARAAAKRYLTEAIPA